MSLNDVKNIILRAATDSEYRAIFFNNFDKAMSKHRLTEEEKRCLYELATAPNREDKLAQYTSKNYICINDIRI